MSDTKRSKWKSETNIIAIRILHKREGIVRDLVYKLDTLVVRGVVNASLQDTAPVAVSGDFNAVRRDGIVDEL